MPKEQYKVLIVDDHIFSSSGVSQLLSSTSKYEVSEERINDGLQVYAACGRIQPDIIILDLGLPGMDGIDIIHQIKKRWPEIIFVVLTANTHEHRATEARKAGASGYVLKKSPQSALLSTLEIAISGKICFDQNLNHAQIFDINKEPILENQSLTARERQTLKLIAEGNRNRDIAEKLSISIKTVETHRLNLMRKLNAHCIADLVNLATRIGLTSD
ncbi:two component system response regulator [Pseudomonas sp. IPO3774]|uniref:two component system response regulator n=1 Tax=Pseudomonas sp. IPO3774 TaxID=2738826 RepID=UPI0015A19694|nr:two component system response regulator [Pseudomonas sp. IPO3774]NWD65969.1 two component system response regulator [Pseudomonas sp. IPO3774]